MPDSRPNTNITRALIRITRENKFNTVDILNHELLRLTEDLGEGLQHGKKITTFDRELRIIEILTTVREEILDLLDRN
jgi:hypothetical protein